MRRNWTRHELILAFSFYCQTPFGKLHRLNPDIIKLSKMIDRTPNAVALKLVNFSSLDPELKKRGIKGMGNYAKMDKIIFDEFHDNWEKLFLEAELLYEFYKNKDRDTSQEIYLYEPNRKIGEEIITKTKRRINQNFFRKIVLSNYNENCAICSLNYVSLLVASHIIPWSKNKETRLNPHNGICLCSIHDKAFDQGLISFDGEFKVIISPQIHKIKNNAINNYFINFNHREINFPKKFYPSSDFLSYHRNNIFIQSS
ncbi:HNH endonuclease [Cyanobacterium aponinum UTEX 3222]|uniref:HNH endonuclease n=1 Tax=Cyanobacterium aponinum 0216 TaxID=2676140 RepID=A0A844GVR4_9CHRO|nr:HNH endonuclease [Cyanobacterium aponinum]MTF38116.1 HNH endonuclease [Cyanobacterium aponinum 0216]WRL42326.1 HNH endonuclease [Cyanobacterium aponinum UTEX 3222]